MTDFPHKALADRNRAHRMLNHLLRHSFLHRRHAATALQVRTGWRITFRNPFRPPQAPPP